MSSDRPHPTTTGGRRGVLRLVVGIAATLAVLALYDAARVATPGGAPGWALASRTDLAVAPEAPPGLTGGGFAADDDDQSRLQQQLDQQQLQQSMQQAEQQNEQAQQQFNQDMQQQQTYENQFNDP